MHIPKTVEALKEGLGSLERLLTAKQWERAAIVYAWTEPSKPGPKTGGKPPRTMGLAEFARLGIKGLKDKGQVREYRAAWESAHADGQASLDIKPGDDIDLPNLPWKDHFGEPTAEVQERVAKSVMKDPVRAKEVMQDPEVYATVEHEVDERRAERLERHTGLSEVPHKRPYDQDVMHALQRMHDALTAESKGEWTPSTWAVRGMALFGELLEMRLRSSASVSGYQSSRLFEEIEEFVSMKEGVEA